jgi:hypothetical protein
LTDGDFRYIAGFAGSNTLPSNKVSPATPRSFAASSGESLRLALAVSALAPVPASYFAPADILGDEPEVVAHNN